MYNIQRRERIWKLSVSLNFTVNLKLLRKSKCIKCIQGPLTIPSVTQVPHCSFWTGISGKSLFRPQGLVHMSLHCETLPNFPDGTNHFFHTGPIFLWVYLYNGIYHRVKELFPMHLFLLYNIYPVLSTYLHPPLNKVNARHIVCSIEEWT